MSNLCLGSEIRLSRQKSAVSGLLAGARICLNCQYRGRESCSQYLIDKDDC
jgi:hypothetical protein